MYVILKFKEKYILIIVMLKTLMTYKFLYNDEIAL